MHWDLSKSNVRAVVKNSTELKNLFKTAALMIRYVVFKGIVVVTELSIRFTWNMTLFLAAVNIHDVKS